MSETDLVLENYLFAKAELYNLVERIKADRGQGAYLPRKMAACAPRKCECGSCRGVKR